MSVQNELGKRIQKARQSKSMTQEDLSRKAKISYSTITKIERGAIKAPSIFMVQKLAEAMGISIVDIIYPEGENQDIKNELLVIDLNDLAFYKDMSWLAKTAEQLNALVETVENDYWAKYSLLISGEMTLKEFSNYLTKKYSYDGNLNILSLIDDSIHVINEEFLEIEEKHKDKHLALVADAISGESDMILKKLGLDINRYSFMLESNMVGADVQDNRFFEAIKELGSNYDKIHFKSKSAPKNQAASKAGLNIA